MVLGVPDANSLLSKPKCTNQVTSSRYFSMPAVLCRHGKSKDAWVGDYLARSTPSDEVVSWRIIGCFFFRDILFDSLPILRQNNVSGARSSNLDGSQPSKDTFMLATIIIIHQQRPATNAAARGATRQDSQSFLRELEALSRCSSDGGGLALLGPIKLVPTHVAMAEDGVWS